MKKNERMTLRKLHANPEGHPFHFIILSFFHSYLFEQRLYGSLEL